MKMGIILLIAGIALSVSGVVIMAREKDANSVHPTVSRSPITTRQPSEVAESSPEPVQTTEEVSTTKEAEAPKPEPAPKPEGKSSKEKGNEFESYVADCLSACNIRIKEWNQGIVTKAGTIAENALSPDFFVEQTTDGNPLEYWLECKWRRSLPDDCLTLAPSQVERYRTKQRESRRKVFVVVGLGGSPGSPSDLFVVPLDSIEGSSITRDEMRAFYMSHPEKYFKGRMHSYFFNKVFKKKYQRK